MENAIRETKKQISKYFTQRGALRKGSNRNHKRSTSGENAGAFNDVEELEDLETEAVGAAPVIVISDNNNLGEKLAEEDVNQNAIISNNPLSPYGTYNPFSQINADQFIDNLPNSVDT